MPSLNGIVDLVKKEGLNLIWIIMIGFMIRFLSKQEWVKAGLFLVGAGLTYYVVQNPMVVADGLKKISELLFK